MRKIKKLCLLLIALVVIMSTIFGASGCQSGFESVKTDEDRYAALTKASQDFLNYKGAISMNVKLTLEENGTKTETVNINYSVNSKKDRMYLVLSSKGLDFRIKVFKRGGKSYAMSRVTANVEANGKIITRQEEKYYSLTPVSLAYLMSSAYFNSIYTRDLSEIIKENTYGFAETKTATEKVVAEQLAEKLKSDNRAHAEYDVKTQKKINSISLQQYLEIKMKGKSDKNDWGTYTVTNKTELVGKKGKISKAKTENTISFLGLKTNSTEIKQKITIDVDIEYAFNSLGYLSIRTSSPIQVEAYTYSEDYNMKFNINGVVVERSAIEYMFNSTEIFYDLTRDLYNSAWTIEWFEDSAYTKPFDPKGLTYKQFHNIECIYGKLTPKEGYAVVVRDYKVKDQRSEDYKIAFTSVFETTKDYEVFSAINLSDIQTYLLPSMGDDYETAVNGEIYGEELDSFALDSGKFYHVEHFECIKDERFSIFDVDVSSLWLSDDSVLY